ncbi:hypothetical protein DYB30_007365 [Aphanomyces astaci]|uniref:Uncharacterized protein n=1 Tax=Aphanomyces astaci TaxID=112090 RepID=A0A397DKP0_APHAT|nr:hypothetical protein DYB30_007365 [Aphanomyces astaci]
MMTTNIQVKQQHLELGPNRGTDAAIAHEMSDEGGIEAITQFGGEGEMQGGDATSSESINCNDDVLLRVLEVSTNTSAVKDTGEERASGEDVGGQDFPTPSTPLIVVQSSIEVDVDQPPFNISVRSSEQPNALDPSTLDTPHRPVDDVDKPPNDAAGSDDIAAFDDESDVSLSAGEEGTHDGKTSPLRSSPGTANVVGRGLKKMPAMMMSPTFSSAMTFHATTSSSRCRDRYEDETDGGGGSHDEFGCNDDASPGQSVRTFPSSASSSSPAAATVAIRPNSTAYSIAKRDFDDDDLDEEFIM